MKRLGISLGVLVVLVTGWWAVKYYGRIYPGVKVAGIDVGGKTENEAEKEISTAMMQVDGLRLIWGTSKWNIKAGDIALNYDPHASSVKAEQVSFKNSLAGVNLEPEFSLDENQLVAAVASVAAQINIPAREPEITIQNQSVLVSAGENGQEVDERSLVVRIKAAIDQISQDQIQIPVVKLEPKLSDEEVDAVKSRAQKLLGKTIELTSTDINQKWTIDQNQLVTWVDPSAGKGQIGWRQDVIEAWIAELAQTIDRPPQNATFKWVGQGRVEEFEPAQPGLTVKQDELKQALLSAADGLEAGTLTVALPVMVDTKRPDVETANVNNLGIKERIGQGESWFTGSIDNRIFNIQKAAALMNGVLVAPGEEFSFNQRLGDVSAATGFKQAYVIKDGKTVLGDGGGVCQVSTTLFRAILNAGLPIDERVAHAYRVSYYEEGGVQPGFDATVFQPAPDFKFKNDTSAYVLIQTDFDPIQKHLIFNLYGTSDGRVATISKSRMWDVTPPPPDLYQDDPTLAVGKVVQTEHAAWGAKVAFDWKVIRGNEVLQDRTFYSNFQPWQAVYLRGTKVN